MTSTQSSTQSCIIPPHSLIHSFGSDGHRYIPQRYLELARQGAADCGVPLDKDTLLHIVEAGFNAQNLLFSAAAYEPSQNQLDDFFESFLLRCIAVSDPEEAR